MSWGTSVRSRPRRLECVAAVITDPRPQQISGDDDPSKSDCRLWCCCQRADGLYIGGGVQWRDVLPTWNVGLDYRYGDKIYRIRVPPSDPQGGYRDDS